MEIRFQHIFLTLGPAFTPIIRGVWIWAARQASRARPAGNLRLAGPAGLLSCHLWRGPGLPTALKPKNGITAKLALISLLSLGQYAWANDGREVTGSRGDASKINNEVFELGIVVGLVNIADFNNEMSTGLSATFKASEDFFLQYNLFQADASPSSYERSQGRFFEGKDRTFRHYDLLVGYNLFQGEFFPSGPKARLSALYLVSGVGETQFGGEGSFTYTLGVGYQAALTRRFILRVDYRNYIYTSNLITDEDKTVNTTQFSSGLSFLF